jgi:hypothetical protein
MIRPIDVASVNPRDPPIGKVFAHESVMPAAASHGAAGAASYFAAEHVMVTTALGDFLAKPLDGGLEEARARGSGASGPSH